MLGCTMNECRIIRLVGAVAVVASGAAAQDPALQFTDRTQASGLEARFGAPLDTPAPEVNAMTGGLAAIDVDRDGWQDLFVLSGGHAPDRLFINNRDGTFTERAAEFGVDAVHYGAAVSVADANGDGWLDMYVTSHGDPVNGLAVGRHMLYLNVEGQRFVEVAEIAGVNLSSATRPDGFGSAWDDIDRDGDLDLAVTSWVLNAWGNRIFVNEGNDENGVPRFVDRTDDVLLTDFALAFGFAPRFVDMDGDRDSDIYWVSDFTRSRAFENLGDGTFVEITDDADIGHETNGMGIDVADFNRDGLPDFYVTSIFDDVFTIRDGNKFYLSQGGLLWDERAKALAIDDGGWGWATVAVDLNLDGVLDIVETNGWVEDQFRTDPTFVYLGGQTLDGSYIEVSADCGINVTEHGRGLIRVDYDNDGDQDLALLNTANLRSSNSGGVVSPTRGSLHLFENRVVDAGVGRHWVRIFLDTQADRHIAPDGVGTRVAVTAGGVTQYNWIQAGPTYNSQNELSVHFGLGDNALIDAITIDWPDGRTRVINDVPADQTLVLTSCPADYDGNHTLDQQDVAGFLDAFVNQRRSADLDASGDFSFFDVSAFVQAFIQGCPQDR